MENASKALIIAGAILISILLISVGIVIMNAINEPVESATDVAGSMGAETFNSKFDTYSGVDIDYTTAKNCITAVKSTQKTGAEHKIELTGTYQSITDLSKTGRYTIDFVVNPDDGYYYQCNID